MDKQSTHQKKPIVPTHPHPTKTSVKSPVHQEDDLQGAIGNRQMGLLMETHPHIHPSSLNATMVGEMPMLGGMMPVSQGRIQRQPLFGGLSQEMRLENATLALPATGALVQRKLTLGTPGDMYEQEAERVARQVVDEIHSTPSRVQNAQSEEERIPAGGEAGRVQRQITVRSAGDAGGELSSEWEGQLQRAKSGGQPLSPSVKEPMERAFGADFGGVRVHTGAQADGLEIGAVGGKYEPEADRVAAQDLDRQYAPVIAQPTQEQLVQRQESTKNDIKDLAENAVQNVQEERKPSNQTGLPDELKAGVENLSGYSLDDVRVHYNSPKPAQLQALAYTQGTEIHVAPGQEKHIPHEAWHVVQQMQGRVKPTMQMKGVKINDDEGLEREANVMGYLANIAATRESVQYGLTDCQMKSHAVLQGLFLGKFIKTLAIMWSLFSHGDTRFFNDGYGKLLKKMNPDGIIGKIGNEYSSLWTLLENSETDIYVEDGPTSFEPNGKLGPTLYFKGHLLSSLYKGITDIQRGDESHAIGEEFGDHLAMVTHELRHAADSVIEGKELVGEKGTSAPEKKTLNVIKTEFNAWASEALANKESGKGNKTLLNDWKKTQKSMLKTWKTCKNASQTNEVIARYIRYVERNIKKFDELGNAPSPRLWHEQNKDMVWVLMFEQKNRVWPTDSDVKEDL